MEIPFLLIGGISGEYDIITHYIRNENSLYEMGCGAYATEYVTLVYRSLLSLDNRLSSASLADSLRR